MADSDSDSDDVRADLADLSARVARLEVDAREAVRSTDDADAPTDTGPAGSFWVLDGLKSRFPGDGAIVYAGNPSVAAGPVEWQIGYTLEHVMAGDWADAATALAALGHPVRLSLLHAILAGATTVAELADVEGLGTTGQLYHHLNQLVAQGWLASRGRGRYGIPPERVVPLLITITAARRGT